MEAFGTDPQWFNGYKDLLIGNRNGNAAYSVRLPVRFDVAWKLEWKLLGAFYYFALGPDFYWRPGPTSPACVATTTMLSRGG